MRFLKKILGLLFLRNRGDRVDSGRRTTAPRASLTSSRQNREKLRRSPGRTGTGQDNLPDYIFSHPRLPSTRRGGVIMYDDITKIGVNVLPLIFCKGRVQIGISGAGEVDVVDLEPWELDAAKNEVQLGIDLGRETFFVRRWDGNGLA